MKAKYFNKGSAIQTVAFLVVWGSAIALGAGLVNFERVNYITTLESLQAVFGAGFWVTILAWGVVLTDIAALARIFTPETTTGKEPKIVQTLWSIWVIVSLLDATLNWFFATLEMEANMVRVPKALVGYEWILPIVAAIVIYGVQFGLLYLFGQLMDNALHGRIGPRMNAQPQARQAQPQNRPVQAQAAGRPNQPPAQVMHGGRVNPPGHQRPGQGQTVPVTGTPLDELYGKFGGNGNGKQGGN